MTTPCYGVGCELRRTCAHYAALDGAPTVVWGTCPSIRQGVRALYAPLRRAIAIIPAERRSA